MLGSRSGRRYPTADEVDLVLSVLPRSGMTLGEVYNATKAQMCHGVRRDRAEIALQTLLRQGRAYYVQRGPDKRWYPIRRSQA